LIAVQGPKAVGIVADLAGDPGLREVPSFGLREAKIAGVSVTAARTGYTGEDGFELFVAAADAPAVWKALLDAGVEPIGLGARDTLRLEAGLPLHGHELGAGITPLQANLSWVVSWDKGPFRGRDALLAERETGPVRRLRGLVTDGRRPPREGSAVLRDGEVVGEVTSGNFAPELGHGVALAFLPPETVADDELFVDVRGTHLPARVVSLPFVAKK
jgi:aminomethyltransferase